MKPDDPILTSPKTFSYVDSEANRLKTHVIEQLLNRVWHAGYSAGLQAAKYDSNVPYEHTFGYFLENAVADFIKNAPKHRQQKLVKEAVPQLFDALKVINEYASEEDNE